MADSKILFLDLDGTLLRDDKTISKKNIKAIHKALESGSYVVVATGRPVESGRHVVRELGLTMPGCYMIAFNGGVIYDCSADRVLYEKTLHIQQAYYLFEQAKKAGIYIQTYNNVDILTEEHTKELDYYVSKTGMSYKLIPNIAVSLEEEPNKMLLIDLSNHEKLEQFKRDNEEWAKDKLNCFFSCSEFLEYCPYGVSKGEAIKILCEHLNISLKNTIAVGDERNDISMLQMAGVGIAMANAIDVVKEAADDVTRNDNNHDAIAEIIEKYVL